MTLLSITEDTYELPHSIVPWGVAFLMPLNTLSLLIYHVINYYFKWFFSSGSNLALNGLY